jgi:hypothetical protein
MEIGPDWHPSRFEIAKRSAAPIAWIKLSDMEALVIMALSFLAALKELTFLLSQRGCPREAIDGSFQVFERFDKCLFVKTQLASASVASEPDDILQPSDLFLRYLSAVRACDWPQVRVIEHEIRS